MRLRRLAWLGATILLGSTVCSLALLLLRFSSVQESRARLMAATGMGTQLLVLLCAAATLGAVLTLGEIRQSPRSRFRLCAVGVGLTWCVLIFVAAPSIADGTGSQARAENPEFTLLVQNLWFANREPNQTAQDVLDTTAQVLVLLEFTHAHAEAFHDAGSSQMYPYRYEAPEAYGHGIAIMSKLPFTQPTDLGLSGAGVRVSLQLDQGEVDLYAAHFNSPTSVWDIPRWKNDFSRMSSLLDQASGSLVVAGDLNATEGHVRFRKFLQQHGLTDAQNLTSIGFASTWPASGRLPTLLRLDHILLGGCLELNSFRRLPPHGSDHLGLLAGLSLVEMRC